ncbi:MAG: NifB/NifX family molybdenum-iron cluster-binding protein [Brevinematales bacterium]|nr:NifB/NifX family molybdenum-iron cluster-binding protein [Brevinematales bacterium]
MNKKTAVITSNGDNLTSEVDSRFGRCSYMIFIDPLTMEYESVKNPFLEEISGVGPKTAQFIIDRGVNLVLTGEPGPHAEEVLKSSGIKVIPGLSGRKNQEVLKNYTKNA